MRSRMVILSVGLAVGCAKSADSGSDTGGPAGTDPSEGVYAFSSRTGEGSSVATSGQILRHLLINDLDAYLDGLTADIDSGRFPAPGEIEADLDFYFSFDDAYGEVAHRYTSDPAPLQATYGEVSSGKDLVGKLAGNDPEGQHADWSTALVGWDDPAVTTPESLVRLWFAQLDAAAVARSVGDVPLLPDGTPAPAVYVTAEGHDLKQLTQKFLLGAIAFSQAADDYLDDADAGRGMLSPNTLEDGEPYTTLEHAWDEAFGYFGAARDYPAWSDDEIADVGARDSFSADGRVDLTTEVCWGASTNAAKRDRGSVAATDFTAQAWDGFWGGRALIASVDGELSDAELDALRGHRDQAIGAWEAAIAATMVHYINEVLVDMGNLDTPDYAFADHAKHWSELKGFAFTPQFNPASPLSDADLAELHALIGPGPVPPTASATDRDAAAADLLAARALLGAAYGFDSANLGGDDGTGGW
jgi:hypothetical protein